MSVVSLVSGGLDSTLMAVLAQDLGEEQYPLFVDFGQCAKTRELAACRRSLATLGIPEPVVMNVSGFGRIIRSGLTDQTLRVYEDAFTPGRNLLFLMVGAAYAHQVGADTVGIGLLHEDTCFFPDQTLAFLSSAEAVLALAIDRPIRVAAPLASFHKADVVALAREKGIKQTYSCHVGDEAPCGRCIACREFEGI